MRLSECRPGEGGTITRVHGEGPIVQRLLEMGVIEGAAVKVVRVAPMGDPLEIEIQSYYLSLRKAEAHNVEIEP